MTGHHLGNLAQVKMGEGVRSDNLTRVYWGGDHGGVIGLNEGLLVGRGPLEGVLAPANNPTGSSGKGPGLHRLQHLGGA